MSKATREPTGPLGIETAAGRPGGRIAASSKGKKDYRWIASRLLTGMLLCKEGFVDDRGRHHKAGCSWWLGSALPPKYRRYFTGDDREVLAVLRRDEGLYGVPSRRRFNKWRL